MFARSVVCGVFALLLASTAPIATASAEQMVFDVSDLVAKLLPSVVSITKVHYEPAVDANGKPLANGAMVRKEAYGSGYIIDDKGIIITNRHVTDDAAFLYVTLYEGTRLAAALMYRSPDIDLAVVRIRSMLPLQAIKWGDSDEMKPGMTVIAIGNPLDFGFTVTHGIVSAKDRDITETPLDNFLQIDASINPGNSGGPLFNDKGEVIGMNTALYQVGEVGGSVGLNFAIPGNDVQFVVNQLLKTGRVRLGTIGAVVNNLNQDMADAVGLPQPEGVVIAYIPPGSPAADAKLQVGDIILQVAGHDIDNMRRLKRVSGALGVGDTVPFLVLRDGARLTIPVKLGEAPDDDSPANRLLIDAQPAVRVDRPDLGLTGETVTDANRATYGIPEQVDGVVVTAVMINTMGSDLGITPGDVVMRINGDAINSMAAMHDAVVKARTTGRRTMLVLMLDHTGTHWIAVPVPPPA